MVSSLRRARIKTRPLLQTVFLLWFTLGENVSRNSRALVAWDRSEGGEVSALLCVAAIRKVVDKISL